MCNPGSLKRVIRIFYLYALILDFIFCNKLGFYLSESLKKGKSEQLLFFYE